MNTFKKWLGLYTKTDKIKEYRKLLIEKSQLTIEINELAKSFAINKAQYDDLYQIPEQREKGEMCFAEFLKNQTEQVSIAHSKQRKLEKAMETMEKEEDLIEILSEMREVDGIRSLWKEGTIKKSVYFDLLKAKQGKVRFADVIVYRGDKILVLQRAGENGSYSDKWCIPGGHVDAGEDFKEAAIRELYEETGLSLHESTFIEVGTYSDKACEIHYFQTRVSEDEPAMVRVDGAEEIGSDWINPTTEMDKHEFIYDMKENLKRIFGIECCNTITPMLEAFQKGAISKSVFDNFCLRHKEDIRKANNKNYFSHGERKDLSEKGEAMSNGKYPIRNSQDLKDAIRLVGASSMPESEVKAWIKKRAKELNLEKELPESWEDKKVEKATDTADAQILSKESLDKKPKGPEGSGIGDLEKATKEEISSFGINVNFNDLEQAEIFKSLVEGWKQEGKLDIESISLGTPIEKAIEKEDPEVRKKVIDFLCWIEGCKTRLKNLHWSEEDNSKHVYLDDLNTDLNEFEDKFAEAIQAGVGRFEKETIQGTVVESENPIEIVSSIFNKVEEMRSLLNEKEEQYHGEISWLDDFAVTLKQDKYRIEMI